MFERRSDRTRGGWILKGGEMVGEGATKRHDEWRLKGESEQPQLYGIPRSDQPWERVGINERVSPRRGPFPHRVAIVGLSNLHGAYMEVHGCSSTRIYIFLSSI